MPLIFIIIIAGYLLGNIYIFVRGLQAFGQFSFVVKCIYSVSFWICALLIIGVFAFRNMNVPISVSHILFRIGTGWLVFTLYMTFFLICFGIVKHINHSFHSGFIFSLILTICTLIYGYVNYKHPVKKIINIDISKPLDNGLETLKIVAISDLHIGIGTVKADLKKYVNMINAEKPDIILISGDLFDNGTKTVIEQKMEEELNLLSAPMGIYLVPGNHEYISGINECINFIRQKTQIRVLRDSMATLPCGLQIIGRDDYHNLNRMPVSDFMSLTKSYSPVFILDHQPRDIKTVQKLNADLQISGHTHNGQIIPLNLLTNKLFEIGYGYEKRGSTNFYVSSGLSLWGPPFRIGSHSEIAVFNCSFGKRLKRFITFASINYCNT